MSPVLVPEPEFRGVEADLDLGDVRLPYWDTRVDGPAVALLHPHTCGGTVWPYQHAGFAAHGYRTVSYTRRGHTSSGPGCADGVPPGSDDLEALRAELGIDRVHLLGAAAGGAYALDYALRFPDRVLSLVLASSLAGIREPGFVAATRALLPDGWSALPVEFRELGPAYRASDPMGARRYAELASVRGATGQSTPLTGGFAALAAVSVPTLLITGGADLYLPPPRLRELARHLPDPEVVVLPEAGHAGFWECPEAFNAAVLDFFDRHEGGSGA
ncbi:alpha/beta hydrolase [Actinomadura meridiana]|uniref:Alpha/beta hydrolase n=1 Tax=Actinomadura meridiana TaxID=559626 RepID=A0ABP8C9P3_9ACTN